MEKMVFTKLAAGLILPLSVVSSLTSCTSLNQRCTSKVILNDKTSEMHEVLNGVINDVFEMHIHASENFPMTDQEQLQHKEELRLFADIVLRGSSGYEEYLTRLYQSKYQSLDKESK